MNKSDFFPLIEREGKMRRWRLIDRREEMGLSQKQLAERMQCSAGVLERFESGKTHKLQPQNERALLVALRIASTEPPRLGGLTNDLHHLIGERWSYHWTKNDDKATAVKVCRWEIESNLHCKVTQMYEENPMEPDFLQEIPEDLRLVYEGDIQVESKARLVVTLDCHDSKIEERAIYRFQGVPLTSRAAVLEGHWFGIDHNQHECLGAVILSQSRIEKIADVKRRLSRISPCIAEPDVRGEIQITLWNDGIIENAILTVERGETITILTTCFSQEGRWLTCIKRLAKRLNKEKEKQNLVHIRLLFLDFRMHEVLELRARYREVHEDADWWKGKIKEQARAFVKLAASKDLQQAIKLETIIYKGWPFGMCFQIGQKAMYFGPIMAQHSPAMGGPLFILENSKTELWDRFAEDLNALCGDGAEAAEDVLGMR